MNKLTTCGDLISFVELIPKCNKYEFEKNKIKIKLEISRNAFILYL